MARDFDNSTEDSIWNRTVLEALSEIRIDPNEVHDVIALLGEKRRREALKAASPRVADIAEIYNAEPDEIVALLDKAHERRLARQQAKKRKAKIYLIGFIVLLVIAAVLANINFWPQKSSLNYVRATPASTPAKLLLGSAPRATYDVVYDFHPSSVAEWLIGPQWNVKSEFLSSDKLPHTITTGDYGYDSVTTVGSRRLQSGVVEYRRRYQFALPATGSKAIYIVEGVNAGGNTEAVFIPAVKSIGKPSTIFEVTQTTITK